MEDACIESYVYCQGKLHFVLAPTCRNGDCLFPCILIPIFLSLGRCKQASTGPPISSTISRTSCSAHSPLPHLTSLSTLHISNTPQTQHTTSHPPPSPPPRTYPNPPNAPSANGKVPLHTGTSFLPPPPPPPHLPPTKPPQPSPTASGATNPRPRLSRPSRGF